MTGKLMWTTYLFNMDNPIEKLSKEMAEIVARESDKAFKKGFREGLLRHTWQKDGITYVGNGTYTLSEAISMAAEERLTDNIL